MVINTFTDSNAKESVGQTGRGGTKSPWDQKSLEQKVLGTKVHGKKSLGQKVHGTKSPWDKKSVGQKVIGQKSMRKKSQEKIPAKNSAKLSNETFL